MKDNRIVGNPSLAWSFSVFFPHHCVLVHPRASMEAYDITEILKACFRLVFRFVKFCLEKRLKRKCLKFVNVKFPSFYLFFFMLRRFWSTSASITEDRDITWCKFVKVCLSSDVLTDSSTFRSEKWKTVCWKLTNGKTSRRWMAFWSSSARFQSPLVTL